VLLFLLMNLVELALAQSIAWILTAIAAYKSVFKPYYQSKKK